MSILISGFRTPIILTTFDKCVAHRYHWPKPLAQELHHVVPQAWQKFWQPELQTGLWHPETVALCPTGHRNVHRIIVAKMRALAGLDHIDIPKSKEAEIAQRALSIYIDAGGSLMDLTRAGQWGQA